MLREERFLKITDYLKKVRTAKFSEIAQYLGVSEATARKDIAFLDSKGAVRLTRGGAVWNQDDITKQVSKVRNIINREEKRQLVRSLGSFVMDGQAVALNGGTTTVEAARFLAHNYRRLTVLTNNLTALSLLKEKPGFTLIVPGGRYFEPENTVTGKQVERDIARYNMDFAIVAVNSISLEKGITDFRMEECGIIKAMISASRRTLVVADHTKFQRVACMNVCPLEDVSAFLTDGGLDSETAFLYRQAGADIVKPSPEGK